MDEPRNTDLEIDDAPVNENGEPIKPKPEPTPETPEEDTPEDIRVA